MVPLVPRFRPPTYHPRLAQPWVEVKPQVTIEQPKIEAPVSIQIGLGSLPLSIGLFAGAGVVFLVRSGLPEGWPQTVATIAGAGLAVGGVANLIFPKAPPAPAAAAVPVKPGPVPPPPPPSGAVEPGKPGGFVPPTVPAFSRLVIEMVSPAPDQEVEHTGTFLGIGTKKIPVQLRLYNPTDESVTVNLDFEWDEMPSVIGYNLAPAHGAKSYQVTVGPQEERNEPFSLPMVGGFSTTTTVALSVYKKRTPNENQFLMINRTFSVT
jgi:hypothetical protein